MSVRIPGAGLYLTAEECGFYAWVEAVALAKWRDDNLPNVAQLQALAQEVRAVATEASLARKQKASELVRNLQVPFVAGSGSDAPELFMTVHAAAEKHKISERAVIKAIESGRLDGRRVEHGRRWEITAESVDRYAPRKRKEKT